MRRYLAILILLFAFPAYGALDPLGCDSLSNAELRALGYEPVTADNTGNSIVTASIQATIDTAYAKRRVVYFRPGTYKINASLKLMIDKFGVNGNESDRRMSIGFLGSYCGNEKPTLVMADGTDTRTSISAVGGEPTAMIVVWRANDANPALSVNNPDIQQGGKHYNAFVRNLKLVTGNNSGVVGVRMKSAEGSNYSELTIDATGGFSGTYQTPSSGGYVYDLEVIGGKFGVFIPDSRGGSPVIVGLKLSGQTIAPIANAHYGPLNIVGFDIQTAATGLIYTPLQVGTSGSGSQLHVTSATTRSTAPAPGAITSTGKYALSMIDGKIERTAGTNPHMFHTSGPAIYLRNVYVKGTTNIVETSFSHRLRASNNTDWHRISEYAVNGNLTNLTGTTWKRLNQTNTNNQWYNGQWYGLSSVITVSEKKTIPAAYMSQHMYKVGLCNPERAGKVVVTDAPYNANPNDTVNDGAAIQAAIDAAGDNGMVFLPYGGTGVNFANVGYYKVTQMLRLRKNTELCGSSRWGSVIDFRNWTPSTDSMAIRTVNAADAAPVLADFKIRLPAQSGSVQKGYGPAVGGWDIQSGQTVYRDAYNIQTFGPPGTTKLMWIRNNGGGKVYGVTMTAPFGPQHTHNSRYTDAPRSGDARHNHRDLNNVLNLGTTGRNISVSNTTGNPLKFYMHHCQYTTPPRGAQCEVVNADNVHIYGSKAEGPTPNIIVLIAQYSNDADMTILMNVINSDNFFWSGYEGLVETGQGFGKVNVQNSNNTTLANISRGRRNHVPNEGGRYFVLEDGVAGPTAQGHLTLMKDTSSIPDEPPGSVTPPIDTPGDPTNFTITVAQVDG